MVVFALINRKRCLYEEAPDSKVFHKERFTEVKMANKPLLTANKANDFQTPPIALNPLLPYLKKDWFIWECASGHGNLTKCLLEKGHHVLATDVTEGQDFLTWQPDQQYDCIVTNPPYSLKDQFLKRCYLLGKPFALLMPLTTLEGKRQHWLEEYGIEIILLDKRLNFETPSGEGTGSWFATAWFTNWLNIGKQLTFGKLQ